MPSVDSVQELGQVFLPMSLNGSRTAPYYYFILDTGAGMSAVDQKVAEDLGLPTLGYTELAGTAGVLNVPIKQFDALAPLRRLVPVEELTQYGLVATTQDLTQFVVPMPQTSEAGLLGNDYLRHFIVEIEFRPPALHLSRPQGYAPAGVAVNNWLPMWLDSNRIMRVRAVLDDWLEVELRVDSGAATLQGVFGPYLNITRRMWEQLSEKAQSRGAVYNIDSQIQAGGMGGSVELGVGSISSLQLGPLRFERPRVVVQPHQGIFALPDAVGFISLNLFEAGGWITFDYPAGRIYLPPA